MKRYSHAPPSHYHFCWLLMASHHLSPVNQTATYHVSCSMEPRRRARPCIVLPVCLSFGFVCFLGQRAGSPAISFHHITSHYIIAQLKQCVSSALLIHYFSRNLSAAPITPTITLVTGRAREREHRKQMEGKNRWSEDKDGLRVVMP